MCQMVHIEKGAVKLLDPSSAYISETCTGRSNVRLGLLAGFVKEKKVL